ncbi:MAG: hypothetical protein JNL01_01060 [Bdellovibrionales bacterium]|nr:hypothetical protein [Bdellovibrionales bacterium]
MATRFLKYFFILGLVLPFHSTVVAAETELPTIDRVEGSLIHFKAATADAKPPAPLDTKLYEIKPFGILESPAGGKPYILMSARTCQDCTEEKQVFALQIDGKKSTHFVYPGKILDPKTKALLMESRGFYGKCLPGDTRKDVYLVYQRERLDRRRSLQPSVFVSTPGKSFLEEKLIDYRMPNIKHTLAQVKNKQCAEIEGRNRLMLRKPMSLTPKRLKDDDDDTEDDTGTKENQTDRELPAST